MIENSHVKIWMEDDILHFQYKEGTILGLDAARELLELRLQFSKGKNYKIITYLPNIRAVTPEAKAFLSSEESYRGVEKVAVVSRSPIGIMLVNLFIQVNKPPRPTRLFKNVWEALQWLKGK